MFQTDLLQDKVILVTGGGTGLGRAMGERFLELGAKLAICGRRQEVAAVLGIVLHGTFYCTLALGKRWLEQGQSGTMLNIVTTYAWTGSGYVVPSAAAKAGVLALTRSLAVEWGPNGIRQVNARTPA